MSLDMFFVILSSYGLSVVIFGNIIFAYLVWFILPFTKDLQNECIKCGLYITGRSALESREFSIMLLKLILTLGASMKFDWISGIRRFIIEYYDNKDYTQVTVGCFVYRFEDVSEAKAFAEKLGGEIIV